MDLYSRLYKNPVDCSGSIFGSIPSFPANPRTDLKVSQLSQVAVWQWPADCYPDGLGFRGYS